MSRTGRILSTLLVAAVLAAAALVILTELAGRRPARDLLPSGAVGMAEARGLDRTWAALRRTAFLRTFAGSRTAAELERLPAVAALDAFRTEWKRATGFWLSRDQVLHLVGREAAAAWYPGERGQARWAGAFRMSWRAWLIAGALRLGSDWWPAGTRPVRQRVEGRTVLTWPGSAAGDEPYHAFTLGRLLVVANDDRLVREAARCASGGGSPLSRDAAWVEVRGRLPREGQLYLWAGAPALPAQEPWASLLATGGARAAGLLVRAGRTTEIDAYVQPGERPVTPTGELPATPLLASKPLFFHARRGTPEPLLEDFLERRARQAAARGPTVTRRPAPGAPGEWPGTGLALVITEAGEGDALPRPHGALVLGFRDASQARDAVGLLYPPEARRREVAGVQALVTRESFPLAGEYELLGAVSGTEAVLATDADVLAQVIAAGAGASAEGADLAPLPGDGMQAASLTWINVEKALPLLERYRPVLAGLVRARSGKAADLSRDLELLRAVTAAVLRTGAGPDGFAAHATLYLKDLDGGRTD